MAVPAWAVDHPFALLHLVPDNDILQDLVDSVANMQRPVRVWRPIVEYKLIVRRAIRGLPGVKVIGALLQVMR